MISESIQYKHAQQSSTCIGEESRMECIGLQTLHVRQRRAQITSDRCDMRVEYATKSECGSMSSLPLQIQQLPQPLLYIGHQCMRTVRSDEHCAEIIFH